VLRTEEGRVFVALALAQAAVHKKRQLDTLKSEGTAQLPALTGLRFLAALGVVGAHFGRWLALPAPVHALVARGSVGVSLFFVLSGFILTYTYRAPDSTLRGTARAFYVARFARIYPLYLCGLTLALVTVDPWAPQPFLPISAVLALNLGLLQSWLPPLQAIINGPGWSLSAESFFYLLFPMLLPLCLRLSPRARLTLGLVAWVTALSGQIVAQGLGFTDSGAIPIGRLPEFLCGMLMGCQWCNRRRDLAWCDRSCDTITVLLLVGVAASLIYSPPAWTAVLVNGVFAPAWAMLIYALAHGKGQIAAFLSLPQLVLLGEASYALYILHFPLWDGWRACLSAPLLAALQNPLYEAIYLGLAVGVSILAYQLIERPARRALRRLFVS